MTMEQSLISNVTPVFITRDISEEYCANFTKEDLHAAHNINISSAAFCALIVLVGTSANAFVIWINVFRMESTFRSVLSLNLFISGFISSSFLILNIVYFASDIHWPFQSFMCRLNNFMFHLNMFLSAFMLILYSIDYCFVVLSPLRYNIYRRPSLASREALIAWIIAIGVSIPYFIFKDTVNCQETTKCLDVFGNLETTMFRNRRHKSMVIMAFMLGYCIPFIIIFICSVTAAIIYQQKKTSKYTPALRLIFITQAFFAFCWLPYHAVSFTERFSSVSAEVVGPIMISLASLSSCVNPILYACLSPDFKKAFSVQVFFNKHLK
ncbi:chemerin-like receptor 1 [Hyperolius riggenbachi]|uniref:chemerin-like receptor 1 n=1 Tax=Hyperolius riggenbachi TaxID=752182 RepID=UPI0035A37F44